MCSVTLATGRDFALQDRHPIRVRSNHATYSRGAGADTIFGNGDRNPTPIRGGGQVGLRLSCLEGKFPCARGRFIIWTTPHFLLNSSSAS